MKRAYWHGPVGAFLEADESHILGELTRHHGHSLEQLQRNAWIDQIRHLKEALDDWETGHVLFEYAIPRMGKRADAVLLSGGIVYVIEYKVGAETYAAHALDQVLDYALDLKNFHEGSHSLPIVPVLVATKAPFAALNASWAPDLVPTRRINGQIREGGKYRATVSGCGGGSAHLALLSVIHKIRGVLRV